MSDNNIFNFSKRTIVLIASIVVIILFVIVIFVIPNSAYIEGIIGISSPVVAKVNGQVLTVNDLINYNCNRFSLYNAKCKTKDNYMGQMQNFINYTLEYQYLKNHNKLPLQAQVYEKIYGSANPSNIIKIVNKGNQLYDYYYQSLINTNIENILLKHASGYIFAVNYDGIQLTNKLSFSGKKNTAKLLINSWYKILNNNLKNLTNVYNKALQYYNSSYSNEYISFVASYTNVNYNNYMDKLGLIYNNSINTILNMKSNSISKMYNYYSDKSSINGSQYIGYYYFIVSRNVGGQYYNDNSLIANLRSNANIVVY